jgi:hypothetical protein
MAGMVVMGLAMGVHEGVKKIQDKKEERKAKKAALVRLLYDSGFGVYFLFPTTTIITRT